MGTCKYCGKDAGWFSHSHKECKEKHEQGVNDFSSVVCALFYDAHNCCRSSTVQTTSKGNILPF